MSPTRPYRAAAAALLGSLALSSFAAAAPTLVPGAITKLPEFSRGKGFVLTWVPATASAGSTTAPQYELEVTDQTTAASAVVAVPSGTSYSFGSPLDDGHRYSFRVRAFEVATSSGGLGGLGGQSKVYSDYSDTQRTVVDATAPAVKLSLSSAVLKPNAQLVVHAAETTDPGGAAASGVDPTSYVWNWTDGSTDGGPVVARTFKGPGRIAGTLTVKDRAGNQSQAPIDVTIEAPAIVPVIRLSGLRVLGRVVAGRPSGLALDVNSPARVVVTLRRQPDKKNGVFVRRFARDLPAGVQKLLFVAPKYGRYTLTVAPVGDRKREITRLLTIRRT